MITKLNKLQLRKKIRKAYQFCFNKNRWKLYIQYNYLILLDYKFSPQAEEKKLQYQNDINKQGPIFYNR